MCWSIYDSKNIKELILRGNLLKLKIPDKQSCYEFLGLSSRNC